MKLYCFENSNILLFSDVYGCSMWPMGRKVCRLPALHFSDSTIVDGRLLAACDG